MHLAFPDKRPWWSESLDTNNEIKEPLSRENIIVDFPTQKAHCCWRTHHKLTLVYSDQLLEVELPVPELLLPELPVLGPSTRFLDEEQDECRCIKIALLILWSIVMHLAFPDKRPWWPELLDTNNEFKTSLINALLILNL